VFLAGHQDRDREQGIRPGVPPVRPRLAALLVAVVFAPGVLQRVRPVAGLLVVGQPTKTPPVRIPPPNTLISSNVVGSPGEVKFLPR